MFPEGVVEPFEGNNDDWESYIEHFNLYVKYDNIIENKIVPTFLTLVEKKTLVSH